MSSADGKDKRWPKRRGDVDERLLGQLMTTRCSNCSAVFVGSFVNGRNWYVEHRREHEVICVPRS